MKTTTLFFALLFLFFNSFGQDSKEKDDDFFFQTEEDSIRGCYGKCLIQSKWEIIEKEEIISYETTSSVPTFHYEYDTIKTDFYFLRKNNPNLKYIINYVDTLSQYILISEESRRLEVVPGEYETVTEQYLFREEYESWTLSNSTTIHNSNNWELELIPTVYKSKSKRVLRSPSPTREVLIPAEYVTVIKITPKEDISKHELNNIKLLCKKYYLKRVKKYDSEIITMPLKKRLFKEMKLVFPSKIEYRKIACDISLETISKIQKQLFALGFYNGNFKGDLTDKTKEAIIRYQIKNHLPIGQLDEDFVRNLIGKKTRFHP